jgi:hypothetical protein
MMPKGVKRFSLTRTFGSLTRTSGSDDIMLWSRTGRKGRVRLPAPGGAVIGTPDPANVSGA